MDTLIETRQLRVHFPILKGIIRKPVGMVKAVDGINLNIAKQQWLGLVGESGCGKTTLGKTLVRLIKPTEGHIYYKTDEAIKERIRAMEEANDHSSHYKALIKKHDMAVFSRTQLKNMRKIIHLVHQDPYNSLNPRMRIKDIIQEPLIVHKTLTSSGIKERVVSIADRVGLTERQLHRYPHEFSGGQRQRIAIARAMVTNPEFIVFDEPTSALDVSVQAQILTLLKELKQEQNLTYLYITHNLTVAESVCDRLAVMYLGKIIETGDPSVIFHNPKHPYTKALVAATPIPDPNYKREIIVLPGEVPSPVDPPPGCHFHPRCVRATEECRTLEPVLELHEDGQTYACWHPLD